MHISVAYEFLPKQMSAHAAVVMGHFGIGFDTGQHIIADALDLPIEPGQVVYFSGPSGSGKSSLLRAVSQQCTNVVDCSTLDLGTEILVDGIGLPIDEALPLLAACGLGEAQLLLRTPAELSEGQRYRYRLAKGLALKPQWLLADEFSATLDRTLAKVVARNLRQLCARLGCGCLLASTHEDIVADLQPDLQIRCDLTGEVQIEQQGSLKKSGSRSSTTYASRPVLDKTGRTSLGGITAAITSGRHA